MPVTKSPTDSLDELFKWSTSELHGTGSSVSVANGAEFNPSRFLYHMLPWQYARMILDRARLRLSPVRSWSDPYEAWWCGLLFDNPAPLKGYNAYGVCLTTGAHDEPRWRMAAFGREPDAPIVRLRSSAFRMNAVANALASSLIGTAYLGDVRYKRQSLIADLAARVAATEEKPPIDVAAEMLMLKRAAFRFEQEVRLLWLDQAEPREEVLVEIDPLSVFDQLMVSPHAMPAQISEIESYCRDLPLSILTSSVNALPSL